jgi:CTP synthase (UTP-ammonia lyase)
VREEFACSYELNPRFEALLAKSELRVSGRGDGGEVRVVELRGSPFFLATLFLPQLSPEPGRHALISGFLRAAAERRD